MYFRALFDPPSKMAENPLVGKRLRACMNCSLIQTVNEFREKGCPNCPFLNTNKSRSLGACTSSSFKGAIFLMNPRISWVARWQRINQYIPGMYAMTVQGDMSDKLIEEIEKDGRVYINRSTSFELD